MAPTSAPEHPISRDSRFQFGTRLGRKLDTDPQRAERAHHAAIAFASETVAARASASATPRGPYRSGAVATKLGTSSTTLSQLRDRLISKGLIYATEDYGYIDFSVPRFDEFMRRYMGYRAPTRPRK